MSETERGPPHPMDVALGARIRLLREQRKLSRDTVALELAISPQNLHAYESGTNRIAWSRLTEIASVLQIRVTDLIAPLDQAPKVVKASVEFMHLLQVPGALELLFAFSRLDKTSRKLIAQLAKLLGRDS